MRFFDRILERGECFAGGLVGQNGNGGSPPGIGTITASYATGAVTGTGLGLGLGGLVGDNRISCVPSPNGRFQSSGNQKVPSNFAAAKLGVRRLRTNHSSVAGLTGLISERREFRLNFSATAIRRNPIFHRSQRECGGAPTTSLSTGTTDIRAN
jgi:hypothetical protein